MQHRGERRNWKLPLGPVSVPRRGTPRLLATAEANLCCLPLSTESEGKYRYALTRRNLTGGASTQHVAFILLNPSTADDQVDDPTTRRCMQFARVWGNDSMTLLNLFALRATDPRVLREHTDPVGPLNEAIISAVVDRLRAETVVIAGWGNGGGLRGQDERTLRRLCFRDIHCLGLTNQGHPRHPLYLPLGIPPQLWRRRVPPRRYKKDPAPEPCVEQGDP